MGSFRPVIESTVIEKYGHTKCSHLFLHVYNTLINHKCLFVFFEAEIEKRFYLTLASVYIY